jgi:esterase/lipase superfamily enzyme
VPEKIFISYVSGDKEFVEELRAALESAGFPVWADYGHPREGTTVVPEIERAIEDSARMIVVLSPDSVRSPYLRAEILKAQDLRRLKMDYSVIALALPGVEPLKTDLRFFEGLIDVWTQLKSRAVSDAFPQILSDLIVVRGVKEPDSDKPRGSGLHGTGYPDDGRGLRNVAESESSTGIVRGMPGLEDSLTRTYELKLAVDHQYPPPVLIYYGTDRRRSGSADFSEFYDHNRGSLERGICEVSIPRRHVQGELERPKWWKFQFKDDPVKHFVVLNVTPLAAEDFIGRLSFAAEKSRDNEAFVFIHGFNTTFAEAARRTAQLAYDLGFDGTDGLPIMYSWPSKGGVEDYLYDEDSVKWTAAHLQQFLSEVVDGTGIDRIHLLAHSMGNRALTDALMAVAKTPGSRRWPVFNQVVLAAPDIDAGIFREQIIPNILGKSQQVTLYASSNDKALAASRRLRSGYPRAGESGEGIVLAQGIETVDASDVRTDLLGHGYFADTAPLINDVYHLMRNGLPPDQRNLRPREKGGLRYWVFPRT